MAHLWLLHNRARKIDDGLVSSIQHYCNSTHFIDLHDLVNPHMYGADFASDVIEEYNNRMKFVSQRLDEVGNNIWGEENESKKNEVLDSLDFCLLERKGRTAKQVPLEKLRIYFLAHKLYLDRLSDDAFLYASIDWGLMPAVQSIPYKTI